MKENIGPGPAAHPDNVTIAFKQLSDNEKRDLLNKSTHIKANDRFKITGIQYIPEAQMGAQYYHSANKVPGSKYNLDQPFKRDTSPKIGSQERESNNPVKQTAILSPQYYDTISQYSNVSIKNLQMLEQIKRLRGSDEQLLPQFEQALSNRNQAMKTSYRIKGGAFSKTPRLNNQF